MKLLMIICPSERREQLAALVEKHGVHSFTELPEVVGKGATGKHFGSSVWPGRSALMFTVAPDDKVAELVAALKDCQKTLFPDEGMKAFILPAEEAL